LQGFPHPLHSAELILQLISKVKSRPVSGGDAVTEYLADEDSSLIDRTVTYHAADEMSLLATVADDVRQWALKHAYSSQWTEHFQSSS